ncbi:MAG: DHHA1 domain-containing protein, partial [Clostridia bacterium]
IGTVADIMPLIGENRAIVALGLEMINNCDNLGLTKLLASAGVINKTIDSNTIGFALAPRINAAGRMSSAMRVVELFMEDDGERAHYEAEELCALNKERQEIEINIFKQVLDVIGDVYDAKRDHAIVVAGEGWHHGVIGIVASKITEKFGCPTILISLDGDEGSGSGRSIGSMNLYAALARSKDILIKYGGHAMAVGLSIRRENIDELRHKINDEAAVQLDGFTRSIKVDFKAEPKYLTIPEIEGLKVLEPFGNANLEPCLRIDDAVVQGIEAIGNGRFMRLTLVKDGTYLPCVCFKKTVKDIWFTDGDEVDAVFEPSINDFRGRNVQLVLRDIRPRESKWIAIHETL